MSFLYIFVYVVISVFLVWKIAHPGDRSLLLKRVVAFWVILIPLVMVINAWMPFAGGGDDEYYYDLSGFHNSSFSDIFDFQRFNHYLTQKGYLVIMMIINWFGNDTLLVLKLFNLLVLIVISLIWYKIGLNLGPKKFARKIQLIILLFFPLWYYIFFLLKDLSIVLLQSLLILGLINVIFQNKKVSGLILIFLSSLILLTFRSPLIVQNILIIIASMVLVKKRQGALSTSILSVVFLGFFMLVGIFLLYQLSSNIYYSSLFGITNSDRVLGSNEMLETVNNYMNESKYNSLLFPFTYLFTETAGLSPTAWANFDSTWIRGVLAVPWIFFGVPFLLIGIKNILIKKDRLSAFLGEQQFILFKSPWVILLVFMMSSLSISFIVQDTTRWRIADLPILGAFALMGFYTSSIKIKMKYLIYSFRSAGVLLVIYLALKFITE